MIPFLFVGHAGLALLLLLCAGAATQVRVRVLQVAGLVGIGLAAGTFLSEGGSWRTVALAPGATSVVAVAVAAAWLMVVIGDGGRGDWRSGALVGVGSSAVLLAGTGRWVAPALGFWVCGSLALVALCRDAKAPIACWVAIALSDVLLATALWTYAREVDGWSVPQGMDGWQLWLVAGAAIVRAGALPRVGIWGALGSPAAPAIPLVLAGSFTLASGAVAGAQPWLALALLIGALVVVTWALTHETIGLSMKASWPVTLALAVSFSAPRATGVAGVGAVLAIAALALWPLATGRGQVERGLLVGFVPATAGFAAIAAAATVAFDRATQTEQLARAAPWGLIAGLLPVALLAGMLLGARSGGLAEPETFQPAAVIATWILLAFALVVGIWPPDGLGSGVSTGTPEVRLHVLALIGGVGAAILTRRRAGPGVIGTPPAAPFRSDALVIPVGLDRPLAWFAVVLLVGAAAVSAWLIVEGLRVGFL